MPIDMTQHEWLLYRQDFNALDSDWSGYLDNDTELAALVSKQLGRTPSADELASLVDAASQSREGHISFHEYITGILGPGWTVDGDNGMLLGQQLSTLVKQQLSAMGVSQSMQYEQLETAMQQVAQKQYGHALPAHHIQPVIEDMLDRFAGPDGGLNTEVVLSQISAKVWWVLKPADVERITNPLVIQYMICPLLGEAKQHTDSVQEWELQQVDAVLELKEICKLFASADGKLTIDEFCRMQLMMQWIDFEESDKECYRSREDTEAGFASMQKEDFVTAAQIYNLYSIEYGMPPPPWLPIPRQQETWGCVWPDHKDFKEVIKKHLSAMSTRMDAFSQCELTLWENANSVANE